MTWAASSLGTLTPVLTPAASMFHHLSPLGLRRRMSPISFGKLLATAAEPNKSATRHS